MKLKLKKEVAEPCLLHGMHFTATASLAHHLDGDLIVEELSGSLTFENPGNYTYDPTTGIFKPKS